MRDLFPTILVTAFVLMCIIVMSLRPASDGVVLVLFNPLEDQRDQVAAIMNANALFVGAGRMPGSYLVASDQGGLPDRLHAAGAWFVLNPFGAAGCSAETIDPGRWKGGLGRNLE
ncbi:hypothetical protein [Kordiimonas sp.]|uniref:hypothetical protein n=1 Tax=Kordiimonas sp. TaxID=1970157 RepID=UPI003A9204C7